MGEGLSVTIAGVAIWSTTIYTVRSLLKLLFKYNGWMYEERGKGRQVSLTTRVWGIVVKILSGWNKPLLYSFQGSLPSLPLPALDQTMQRVCFINSFIDFLFLQCLMFA